MHKFCLNYDFCDYYDLDDGPIIAFIQITKIIVQTGKKNLPEGRLYANSWFWLVIQHQRHHQHQQLFIFFLLGWFYYARFCRGA